MISLDCKAAVSLLCSNPRKGFSSSSAKQPKPYKDHRVLRRLAPGLWDLRSHCAPHCLLCSSHVASLLFLQHSRHSPSHLRALLCCPFAGRLFTEICKIHSLQAILNVSVSWSHPQSPYWKWSAPIPVHIFLSPFSDFYSLKHLARSNMPHSWFYILLIVFFPIRM